MPTPTVTFEALYPDVRVPERATANSAGHDVRAYLRGREVDLFVGTRDVGTRHPAERDGDSLVLHPGQRALIPLGFKAQLPQGYEAQLRLRSSVAFEKGLVIPNAPGTVDGDTPDEWKLMVKNDTGVPVVIEHDERIAQVVLSRFEELEWQRGEVKQTTERGGGLGSTKDGA